MSEQSGFLSVKDRLRAKGALKWYDRAKARYGQAEVIPLEDEQCSKTSVYLIKKDGSLWTVKNDYEPNGSVTVKPYRQVRPATKPLPRRVYYCASCKAQGAGVEIEHIGKEVRSE